MEIRDAVPSDARAACEVLRRSITELCVADHRNEPAILARAVQLVQSITDVPLSIDSSIVAALEAGLARYRDRRVLRRGAALGALVR